MEMKSYDNVTKFNPLTAGGSLIRNWQNKTLFTLVLMMVSGCEQSLNRSDLFGTWVSDKDMTLSHIQFDSSESDIEKYDALNGMLGEMAYVFRESGTTFTPFNAIDEQQQWFRWELVESKREQFLVDVMVNGGNNRFVFIKKDGCIGVQTEAIDFVEYFCKKDD